MSGKDGSRKQIIGFAALFTKISPQRKMPHFLCTCVDWAEGMLHQTNFLKKKSICPRLIGWSRSSSAITELVLPGWHFLQLVLGLWKINHSLAKEFGFRITVYHCTLTLLSWTDGNCNIIHKVYCLLQQMFYLPPALLIQLPLLNW